MATARQWLTLILIAGIWGSSFILIKRTLYGPEGGELFTNLQVGSLRIIIAAMVMLPFVFRNTKLLRAGRLKFYLIVGLCGNALPAFLFATAQTHIPSALAGMLNTLVPLFSLVIAYFVFNVKVRTGQIVGIGLGLVSAAGLLMNSSSVLENIDNLWFALLVVAATLCYAISLNIIKQFLQEERPVAITGLSLVLVSPIGFAILFSTDFIHRLTTYDGAYYGLGAVTILAVLGTAFALILFNKLVQETNTVFASSVTYLVPVFAILWGIFDGETLEVLQIIFAGTMVAGIYLINRK